jgi:hypothetical protein
MGELQETRTTATAPMNGVYFSQGLALSDPDVYPRYEQAATTMNTRTVISTKKNNDSYKQHKFQEFR